MTSGRRRVRREAGLLVPGFSKLLDVAGGLGTTYLWGVPIGRFRIVELGPGVHELRYVCWPIVDVLEGPMASTVALRGTGCIRLPGGRRGRFCRFTLEPAPDAE